MGIIIFPSLLYKTYLAMNLRSGRDHPGFSFKIIDRIIRPFPNSTLNFMQINT